MKYLIIIALFCFGFIQSVFSVESSNTGARFSPDTEDSRKYLCYELGFSNIVSIYVAEGDTVCRCFIDDGKGRIASSKCEKAPILKWGFNELQNEIKTIEQRADSTYHPYFYRLSVIKDTCRTTVCSSELQILNNDELIAKIDELREFMIRLWLPTLQNKN